MQDVFDTVMRWRRKSAGRLTFARGLSGSRPWLRAEMPEQSCALRALNSEGQGDGDLEESCLAAPCLCDIEREIEHRAQYSGDKIVENRPRRLSDRYWPTF